LSLSLGQTAIPDISPWAGIFPPDAVTPTTAIHLGIEYRGEVVRAARWSASLAKAPAPGVYLKIILLQNRPKLGLSTQLGPGIAVCGPASPPGRQSQRIIGEITAAKQAAYLTRWDFDAAPINGTLRERQDDLGNRLIKEETERFSKGGILVEDGPGPSPSEIYAGDNPQDWIENLAGWLLSRRYPNLPINTQSVSGPISEDDVQRYSQVSFLLWESTRGWSKVWIL